MTLAHTNTSNDDERRKVLAAIGRLQDGTPQQSNGAHTVVALAAESGIPRQRLYEHHADLLNEFKTTAGSGPMAANVAAIQGQLARARAHNEELAAENAQLRDKIRTLAAVIAELTHEAAEPNVVVPMPRNRMRHSQLHGSR